MGAPVTFRVHFIDGSCEDIIAEKPIEARRKAEKRRPETGITKVKLLKEESA